MKLYMPYTGIFSDDKPETECHSRSNNMAGGRKADKPPSNASTKRTKPNAEDSSLSSSEPILRQTLLSAESRGEHKASFASAQVFIKQHQQFSVHSGPSRDPFND
jgi:hypothetical protein